MTWLSPLGAVLAILIAAGPARSTVLTFDQTRDSGTGEIVPTTSPSNLPSDYGDHVTGAFVVVPGGQFSYVQEDEGFTPNVRVEITGGGATPTDSRVRLWQLGYGDLFNVAFTLQGATSMQIRLTADPDFEVALYGFDLAGFPNSDWAIDGVEVTAGTERLFSQTGVVVEGNASGPPRSSFVFMPPLSGRELLLRIDYGNLAFGQQDNIGLDNLRFGQFRPIPSMPYPGLLIGGLAALLIGGGGRGDRRCPTTMA
jgi:hypothetical protein